MEALVSILCLTYNHEAYIRRALESFVMQKTDFPFEVIVHDDASTDGTAAIIREFEQRYPDIIRPVYQNENQYSKPDTPIIQTFMLPLAKGRYFAFCEGDDAFTDPLKLQRQADFMEQNPDYVMCVHRALLHREGDDSADRLYPDEEKSREFTRDEIIVNGAGLFATNSFFIRRGIYERLPDAFFIPGVGDYPLLSYAAIEGRVFYLSEPMSLHNDGVAGSWTDQIWQDRARHLEHEKKVCDMLDRADAYYEGRLHGLFEKAKERRRYFLLEYEYDQLMAEGRKKEASEPQYRPFRRARRKEKGKAFLKKYFPFLRKVKSGRGK